MSKFKVGEVAWFSPVGILAEQVLIHAVKERKFVKPLYLIECGELYQWEPENKLTKVSDMVLNGPINVQGLANPPSTAKLGDNHG